MKNTCLESYMAYIGEIVIAYFNQVSPFNPTKNEFNLWIDSLHDPYKSFFTKKGLKNCLDQMNFLRFVLELRDYGMDDFMKTHLTDEDYKFWNFDLLPSNHLTKS